MKGTRKGKGKKANKREKREGNERNWKGKGNEKN